MNERIIQRRQDYFNALERLKEAYQKHLKGEEKIEEKNITEYEEKFHIAINDDLNMPSAMSIAWEVAKETRKSKDFAKLLEKFDTVLGLEISKNEKKEGKIVQDSPFR